jgi:hypothetical protein
LIPIEKVKINDEVLTTKGYKLVTDWFDQGERNLVRIVTQDGDFVCTENHRMPVLTSSNEYIWIEANKLQSGHKLISSRTPIEGVKTHLPDWEITRYLVPELDDDMSWFIGLFHTSGYTDGMQLLSIPINMGLITEHFAIDIANKAMKQIHKFDSNLPVTVEHLGSTLLLKCKSQPLTRYFDNNIKQKDKKLRVPEWILQATNSLKLAYIAGICDGDMSISVSKQSVTLMTTIHEDFARDIQKVLYSCGVESCLLTNIPRFCTPINRTRLDITTQYSIGMINSVPQLHKLLNTDCCEKCSTDGDAPFHPVEIIRIEPAGKGYTYDITVDGPNEQEGVHEFFVNGLLSHNTAEMFIFEEDDYEVLFAKYGLNGFYSPDELEHHLQLGIELDKMGIKPKWFDELTQMFQEKGSAMRMGLNHRHMSNNSIMFLQRPSMAYLQLLFKILRYEGEPGLINMEEMKRRRPNAELVNPCGEVLLDSCQTCNLTTVNLAQFVAQDAQGRPYLKEDELLEAQRLSTRAGIRMTLVSLELPHWDEKQKRDRLIGTSLTGIKDTLDQLNYTKADEIHLIQKLADAARQEAIRYAKEIRIPAPLLVTTIKPEGSLSQLAGGVSQGLHLSHSPFFIRRIRINSHDPVVSVVKKAKWNINPEVGTPGSTYDEKMANARTYVIDFPVYTHAKKTKYQTTVEEQLDTYFTYQKIYADHNCSNTISVKNDEWDRLPQIIFDNWDKYLGITFIPLDGGHYELAPYEECNEDTYNRMKNNMDELDLKLLQDLEKNLYADTDSSEESAAIPVDETFKSECVGGICPLR